MTSGPAITGVAEIVLNVRDLPRMRQFYEDVLGFGLLSQACHEHGPEPDPEGEPTIAFLTIKELDTPLGRHGHPQLLALIDYRRHAFARATVCRMILPSSSSSATGRPLAPPRPACPWTAASRFC